MYTYYIILGPRGKDGGHRIRRSQLTVDYVPANKPVVNCCGSKSDCAELTR